MYTNKHAWTNKDGTYKEVYYYICGRNKQERGHHCDYKASLRKTDIEPLVIEAVKELVSDKYFAKEIEKRIGVQTDTTAIDKELANYESKLKEVDLNKARLEREIDNLPVDTRFRERKIHDMTLRLDALYDTIVELEERIEDAKLRKSSIEMETITLDNIYKLMLNFGKLYDIISDEEKKSLITYLIKEIQIYPNGESEQPLKSIEFNFPIYRDGQEVRRLLWEKGNTVETCRVLCVSAGGKAANGCAIHQAFRTDRSAKKDPAKAEDAIVRCCSRVFLAVSLYLWYDRGRIATERNEETMKWIIASDLHGSAHYCRRLLEAWKREEAPRMLFLGDLLYHGPRNDLPEGYAPKEVIALLQERQADIFCVRGNCEAEVDQMVLPFPVLADYCLLESAGHLIYATHGHHFNEDHLPPLHPGDVLLHGHTHIPCRTLRDGVYVLNPGSVSIPKAGSWHGYMTLEDGVFTWKTLPGDVRDTLRL